MTFAVATISNMEEKLIKWDKPLRSWIRINVDSIENHHGFARCGDIISGEEGEQLGGFSENIDICKVYYAELWAVYEDLRTGISMGFKKIVIELDSKLVVKDITHNTNSTIGGNLLCKIKKLLLEEVEVSFKHIFREVNRCVDGLAKHEIQQSLKL